MPATSPPLEDIAAALARHGLITRGGFSFDEAEEAPAGPSGRTARSILLIGNAGAAFWPHFRKWLSGQSDDMKNPLDTWSREVIGEVARKVGARAVSPSDRPFLPFQQWAMRTERLRSSLLGILMHPEYGLWHAYRGALLFERDLNVRTCEAAEHPCDRCVGKPCLTACPVDAYSSAGFAHATCLRHVRAAAGGRCRGGGCLARNACPHGAAYHYPEEQQAFHMAAFVGTD